MDGTWHWDDGWCAYRLNITDSDDFYIMEYYYGFWDVYKSTDGEVDWANYLVYCESFDVTYCAGQWMKYDDFVGAWIYDKDASSQYFDCTYDECDLSGLTAADTNCMYSPMYSP